MEEGKTPKKNNVPTLVLLMAVVMIAAGAILIVTGNNKSLLGNEKENKPEENEGSKGDPKRGTTQELTVEEAKEILTKKKESEFVDATWGIGEVLSVVRGDNNTYLVTYEEISETETRVLETIIFVEDGVTTLELPGWLQGERDLTEYNFGGSTVVEEPTEQPAEQPVEQPTEQPTEQPAEQPVEQPAGTQEVVEQTAE